MIEIEKHLNNIEEFRKEWKKLKIRHFGSIKSIPQLLKLGICASASGQSIGSKVESFLKTKYGWATPKGQNNGDALSSRANRIEIKFSSKYIGGKQLMRANGDVDFYLCITCLPNLNYKEFFFLLTPEELQKEAILLKSKPSYSTDTWGYDIRFLPTDLVSLNRWISNYQIDQILLEFL